ncbi:hypothetical protein AVEN_109332-1 [Araneus ventricosus]|uniref:Reverse transcriptase domain-containing protein n=1 Tax=Araneus ventricosus TaxID=182803 RepID=A0A4Y2D1F4_ARAVE|nr:hypothetical protein AVEN_109332-1 [Araneus ventricosus]
MVISLDIQGAFDHLQYNSIRNSLDGINFPSHTIETLKDILTDWKVTIQTAQGPRKFLLNITGAYSVTPTAALQVIERIIPFHIKAEQEAAYFRTARLRKKTNYNNFNLNNYEDGTTSTKFHPANFQLEDRISLKKQFLLVPGLNIYTDGSRMEEKTGSAFCVVEEDTAKYEWMAELRPFNTVFQAYLFALYEACL